MKLSLLIVLVLLHYSTCQLYKDFNYHECNRNCEFRTTPKYCHFKLNIEYMFSNEPNCKNCFNGTLADCSISECIIADGRQRRITTYNRMVPAPTIQVCKGDIITIDLTNDMSESGTTLHIHGMSFRDNQFMDGTPMVTQGPIAPHTTFRYNFRASEVGTFPFYSGYGDQQADGAYGIMMVREHKSNDPLKSEYDEDLADHVIVLSTVFRDDAQTHKIRNTRMKQDDTSMVAGIAINGVVATSSNGIPAKRFLVRRNYKYKFRVAHVGSESCTMELTVDKHRLNVISSDGGNILPLKTDTLRIYNGERYEFVIETNQPTDTYAIQIDSYINGRMFRSFAWLRYNGASERLLQGYSFGLNKGTMLPCYGEDSNCMDFELITASNYSDMELTKKETFTYFVGFDIISYVRRGLRGENDRNVRTLIANGISYINPTRPLMINPRDTTQRTCNRNNKNSNYCSGNNCECVHLIEVPLNSIALLVFVNEGYGMDAPYSIHTHGFEMTIIGSKKLGQNTTLNQVERNYQSYNTRYMNAPKKSNFVVPNGGYTIVKFKADNPGYWMIEGASFYKWGTRLQMVMKVGDIMPTVPNNFPRCNDYYGVNMFI